MINSGRIQNKSKKRQDTRKKPGKDDKVSTPKKKIDIKGKWSSGNEVPVNHEALYKKITRYFKIAFYLVSTPH